MSGIPILRNLNKDVKHPHGVKRPCEDENPSADERKVKETLKLFRDLHKKLSEEHKRDPNRNRQCIKRFDMEVASRLKEKGKWMYQDSCIGHIPGTKIGDKFKHRAELAVIGLNHQYYAGIDTTVLNGKKVATSVVNSGRYENEAKTSDVLIYSGQGGKNCDQELKHANLALVNSIEIKNPVRVVRKSMSGVDGGFPYVYDGLYIVKRFWREREFGRPSVFKFELHRMSDQEKLTCHDQNVGAPRKTRRKECCVVSDVSQGKERLALRAMNGIDGEKPNKFAYVTECVYPEGCGKVKQGGCNCVSGCSRSGECSCFMKNGGDIVYECGPSCKCPSSCLNRASQGGTRYQLELYKNESGGWSVRSRSYIQSGSFVCEFVGKLQQIKKSDIQEENHDVSRGLSSFIFYLGSGSGETETGFIIDASKVGNVGRFVRYSSSSPCLVVKRVLYDHGDKRMPHVMLFAAKNIPPLQELTCNYGRLMKDQT